jgi:hypothetical protein
VKRGELPPVRRRGARRARRVIELGVLAALGCDSPHYVSLGWNDSAVRAESPASDAGMPAALEDEAPPADFTRANARDRSQACTFGPARVELRGACDERTFTACPELGETPARTLDAVLSSVLRECGEVDNLLSVSFEQGCAVAFELASDAVALAAAGGGAAPRDTASPSSPAPSSPAPSSPATAAGLPDAGLPDASAPTAAAPTAAAADGGAPDGSALDSAVPERASMRRCISERLAAQHFDCARDIACAEGVNFSPLTR